MRETCEHDMFKPSKLVANGGINVRIGMTKQIDPPGTDSVEVAFSVKIVKPYTFAPSNWNGRQYFVLFHLSTWMPDCLYTAFQQIFIAHLLEIPPRRPYY